MSGGGDPAPIACSLGPAELGDRLAAWRRVLGRAPAADRRGPGTLVVALAPGADPAAVADLARREVECCPFLSFGLRVAASGLALQIDAPEEAADVLDAFARLAGPGAG